MVILFNEVVILNLDETVKSSRPVCCVVLFWASWTFHQKKS